jgi:hypothetical protein
MGREQELLETFCFIILIFIISFGTIGNLFSLVIWSNGKNSKHLACSTYFKLISACDICVLLTAGVFELLRFYPVEYTVTEYSTFVCKSVTFGRLFTTQISTWLVVVITFERTISILLPLKHYTSGARRRAYISCLVISVLSLSLTSLFLVAMAVHEDENPTGTQTDNETFYLNYDDFNNSRPDTLKINSTKRCILNQTDSSLNTMTEWPVESGKTPRHQNRIKPESLITSGISSSFEPNTGTVVGMVQRIVKDNGTLQGEINCTIGNLTSVPNHNENLICDFVNLPRSVEKIAWTLNYVILICSLPLAIILVCNFVILVKHCLTRQPRNNGSEKRANNLVLFTRLILAIGLVYTLSTLPMTLYVLTHFDLLKVELKIREIDILPKVARTLFCLNNGTNFMLYFISGEKFREDFKHLFKCFLKGLRQ